MSFIHITADQVVVVHELVINESGGEPSMHYNKQLLLGAIGAAEMYAHYNPNCDAFDVAAVYAYHIANNHAFSDGNKRTALITMITFLMLNLPRLAADEAADLFADVDVMIEGLVDKTNPVIGITKEQLAENIRQLYRETFPDRAMAR